jgi:hypothetical protein
MKNHDHNKIRSVLTALACCILLAIALPSCSGEEPDPPVEVYFSSTSERLAYFTSNPDNTFDDDIFSVGTIRYAGNVNQGTITAALTGGGNELLEKYNSIRETQYLLLPENNYELLTPTLTIENGKKISEEGLFLIKNVEELETEQIYLLPITIRSLNAANNVKLHELKRTSWWLVYSTFIRPLVRLDKQYATVTAHSSTHPGVNIVDNAINGDYADRWHTNAPNYPHYITVNLGETVNIARFGVWPSVYDRGGVDTGSPVDPRFPTRVKFEVSMDGTAWTDLGEFDCEGTGGVDASERVFDVTPTQAQYFRFTGLSSTNTLEISGGNNMVIGEIDVYYRD